MKRALRVVLRILLFLVASVCALWLGDRILDLIYTVFRGEEVTEKNLHVRYELWYQDAKRQPMDFRSASASGRIVSIDWRELIRARDLLDDGSADFSADGWIRLHGKFARDPVIGERIEVGGTTRNDGVYLVTQFDGPGASVKVERALRDENVPKGVRIRGLRERQTWAPELDWYICYRGLQDTPRAPYYDDQGCVHVKMNKLGIRDREEVADPKPSGQKRIVCLGDSFTFAWGVKFEDGWTQRVERELRKRDDAIRTVNCGASGCMYADEYAAALEHRFHQLEPDVVVMTLCLNDLLPTSNALAHQESPPWLLRHSRLLRELFQGYALEATLRIPPDRDLVQELLDLDERLYPTWASALPPISVGRAALWPGGGPQSAMLQARDYCREHHITFGVVIWPFFQSLGSHDHYPFTKIHRLVGDFCGSNEIPFLDLLPSFERKVERTAELWVAPSDYHGNERAQEMATPALTDFLRLLLQQR